MEMMDKIHTNPSSKADYIYSLIKPLIKDESDEDMLAFCIEFIALMSQNVHHYLLPVAKDLSRRFYDKHYYTLWLTLDTELQKKVDTIKDGPLDPSQLDFIHQIENLGVSKISKPLSSLSVDHGHLN